jgi:hypothetical protein
MDGGKRGKREKLHAKPCALPAANQDLMHGLLLFSANVGTGLASATSPAHCLQQTKI